MAEISGAWQGCPAVVSQRLKKQLREQERKFAGCLGLQRSCSLLRRGVSKSCVYAGITLLRAVAGGWGVGGGEWGVWSSDSAQEPSLQLLTAALPNG